MRAKIILSVLVVALALLGPAIYYHSHSLKADSSQESTVPAPAQSGELSSSNRPVVLHRKIAVSPPAEPLPGPSEEPAYATPEVHRDYILQRKAELSRLGMSDDPADLKTILSELNNREPEIRQAALSATVQFGSKDAIPALQNEIGWADDPQEKVDLQKAIDFLQLPSLSQIQSSNQNLITPETTDPASAATH